MLNIIVDDRTGLLGAGETQRSETVCCQVSLDQALIVGGRNVAADAARIPGARCLRSHPCWNKFPALLVQQEKIRGTQDGIVAGTAGATDIQIDDLIWAA